MRNTSGFSVMEMIVAIAIAAMLIGIAIPTFRNSQKNKAVDLAARSIVMKLEEAKANALSGRDGTNFGVKFSANSYVYFKGASFDPGDASNVPYGLQPDLEIVESVPSVDDVIMFSRLTGVTNSSSTVQVRLIADHEKAKTITVGELGDISVIE